MNESITSTTNHFSPAASLAALGVKLSQLDLFGPIRTQVQIKQKTVKHTPTDKLYDAFISRLSGAHGLVEINTRLRTDLALQHAFGRQGCAEQSVVQQTLDACTTENVRQLEQAMERLLPPKATLLGNTIVGDGNWAACWLRSMRKWWLIASLRAMSS